MKTIDQAFTLVLMNELREKKNSQFSVQVVDQFPPLASLTHLTFLGSFSWTSKAGGYKFVKKQFAHDLGAGIVTPADISRDYLQVKYGSKPLRCNKRQYAELVKIKKHQPLYAQPCSFGNASYLDLKSAYWQILQVGGWDVDYCPNRYLSPRSDVSDFPVPEIKLARNSLVSSSLPTKGNIWTPNVGIGSIKPHKISINMVLWGFVMDVLHCIADDMIEHAEAVYCNTDGYIVPDYRIRQAEEVANAWGVCITIRHHGQGRVRGVGDYDIGGRSSARIRNSERPFSYIQPRAKEWLREKFKFWSHRISLDLQPSDIVLNNLTQVKS